MVIPSVAFSISAITDPKSLMEPSWLYKAMVVSSIANLPSSFAFFKSLSMALKVVPAILPLIPLSANTPKTAAVCAKSIPAAFAVEEAYFIASPSCSTLVLLLELAAANMSAASPALSALIWKPLMVSVTISAVVAKSIPAAAARFNMPGVAPNIWLVS